MARMTLLEMTQNILNAMSSDQVNSIFDTVESQSVAEIIKETYYDSFSTIRLPEREGIIQLSGVGDLTRPNYLEVPTSVLNIEWFKYRNSTTGKFTDVTFVPEKEFIEMMMNNSAGANTTLVTDGSGITFYCKTNAHPRYFTILNDKYIVTDSYDASVDSTLQGSKSMVWGEEEDAWTMADSFIPDLDNDLFPMLLSEAKSASFINLKQTVSQLEEKRSRRHRVHLQYRKFKSNGQRQDEFGGPNYARNRR